MTGRVRDSNVLCGVRLALSMLTVAPVSVRRIDRRVGGVAMALAPAIGALLGAVVGAAALLFRTGGAGALLSGALVVALTTLLTRSLHLDGLADTVDALGSYRDRQTALEIMKKSDIGPFGVGAIVLAVVIQIAALSQILPRPPLALLVSTTVAAATGRAAITLACRRGIPAARDTGLGAIFAGTVATPTGLTAAAGIGLLSISAVPVRPWQGPLAVLVALVSTALFTRHVVRRLGGVTGDVLGSTVEIASTLCLIILALGPA